MLFKVIIAFLAAAASVNALVIRQSMNLYPVAPVLF